METTPSNKRIHPLMAAAAVSVVLVSLIGVAAITGIFAEFAWHRRIGRTADIIGCSAVEPDVHPTRNQPGG
ncbi:hypothetical protein ACFS07_21710 [Undibacterium arcticum]